MLGIKLTDFDSHNVPMLLADQYGNSFRSANRLRTVIVTRCGRSMVVPRRHGLSGTAAGVRSRGRSSLGTGHAFLNDIAHHAAPGISTSTTTKSPMGFRRRTLIYSTRS